ncbi:hypothetical protein Scep_013545 [Stephania cephalantha]|uniref:Uncharacterized protein n=1 Tax=Stephania cephalantha TaxID=152367 RepID=A0AAP0P7I1_9MAGN
MARLLEAFENGRKVAGVFQIHGSLSILCMIALTLSLISMAIFACAESGKKRKKRFYGGGGGVGGGGCGGGGGGGGCGGGGGGC